MLNEKQMLALFELENNSSVKWNTERRYSKLNNKNPELIESFTIWMNRSKSSDEVMQMVSDVIEITGVDFEKSHTEGHIYLRHEGEGFKITMWIPISDEHMIPILSKYYGCDIIRKERRIPARTLATFSCPVKTE